MIGTTVIGLLFALLLNRGVKTRYVLRALVFLPIALSPLAVSYIWKYVFQYDGMLNQALRRSGSRASSACGWVTRGRRSGRS